DGVVVLLLVLVGIAAVGEEICLPTEADRFVVIGDGAIVFVQVGVRQAAVAVIVGFGRAAADRFVFVLQRTIGAPELLVGGRAIGEDRLVRRVQPNGLGVIGDGPLVLALQVKGDAAVDEGLRIVAVETDCLVVVLDRAVVGAALQEGVAAGVERVAVAAGDPDHAIEVLDRAIVLRGEVIGFGARLQRSEVVAVEGDRPTEVGDGLLAVVL